MAFEVQHERSRPMWPYLLAGTVIVVVLLFAFGFLSRHSASQTQRAKPLPFGAAEQSYAGNLRFENLKLSRFANMFNQQVTYVAGDIYNGGNRSVKDLEITVEFRNIQNQIVYQEALRPLEPNPVAIEPGQHRDFQLGFDQVPDTWNQADPTIRVTGLLLQ